MTDPLLASKSLTLGTLEQLQPDQWVQYVSISFLSWKHDDDYNDDDDGDDDDDGGDDVDDDDDVDDYNDDDNDDDDDDDGDDDDFFTVVLKCEVVDPKWVGFS